MKSEMVSTEERSKNFPERTTWCGVDYVRADLYDLKEFEAKTNAETVIRQAAIIRKLQREGV